MAGPCTHICDLQAKGISWLQKSRPEEHGFSTSCLDPQPRTPEPKRGACIVSRSENQGIMSSRKRKRRESSRILGVILKGQ